MDKINPIPGDCFLITIQGKTEIALFLGIDYTRHPGQGLYMFTYSHWNFDAANFLTIDCIKKYNMKFSKTATVLFGRQ